MVGDNLLRFNKEQLYLIGDFETENLNLAQGLNRPWEVGWIIATKDKVLEKHEFLVKWPNLNVSAKAAQITGFYNKNVERDGITPEEAAKRFFPYMEDPKYKIIFHNGLNFDFMVYNIWRRELGIKTDYKFLQRVLDTNSIARCIKNDYKLGQGEDILIWQLKMNNFRKRGIKTSIAALCKEHEIDYNPLQAHAVNYDIERNYLIWQKMLWQLEI